MTEPDLTHMLYLAEGKSAETISSVHSLEVISDISGYFY